MIISYRELARLRQREIVRRAEKRRLEKHARPRRPQVRRDDRRTNKATSSARAA